MTQLTATSSLTDVLRVVPGAQRTLESFGLDYCCGGQRTLAEACRDLDLEPTVVLDELQRTGHR